MDKNKKLPYMTACIALSVIIIIAVTVSGCANPRKDYLEKLKIFEDDTYDCQEISEQQIMELKSEISRLEQDVNKYVKSIRELGTFYKMSGIDFFDGGNFGPALESFEKAIEIQTENHVLPYYAALCAVRLGKSIQNETERSRYLQKGEFYYLHSLSLKPNYSDSMYGLAILYLYEMERPVDAFEYIDKYLAIRKSNVHGHFVRAAALVSVGNDQAAIEDYKWIIENSKNDEEITEARRNIDILLGGTN